MTDHTTFAIQPQMNLKYSISKQLLHMNNKGRKPCHQRRTNCADKATNSVESSYSHPALLKNSNDNTEKGVQILLPGSKEWIQKSIQHPKSNNSSKIFDIDSPKTIHNKQPVKRLNASKLLVSLKGTQTTTTKPIHNTSLLKRMQELRGAVDEHMTIDLTLSDSDDHQAAKIDTYTEITLEMMNMTNLRMNRANQSMLDALFRIIDIEPHFKQSPVTKRHSHRLKNSNSNKNNHSVLHTISNLQITIELLRKALIPGFWFCDVIVNAYFGLLQLAIPNALTLSSFFMTLLTKNRVYCYENVRRWTKKHKNGIFFHKRVAIPININNNHWYFFHSFHHY